MIIQLSDQGWILSGPQGQLLVPEQDDITPKLAMIYEAVCQGAPIPEVVEKFGYSKQRYYQLLALFKQKGAIALQNQKRGPKTNYRRTEENIRQVIPLAAQSLSLVGSHYHISQSGIRQQSFPTTGVQDFSPDSVNAG